MRTTNFESSVLLYAKIMFALESYHWLSEYLTKKLSINIDVFQAKRLL